MSIWIKENVNSEHMTFGRRNLVEQVFRSLKLRL